MADPWVLELELSDIPFDVPVHALKKALVEQYFSNLDFDFSVVYDKASETLFWESFGNVGCSPTTTARIIIPNSIGDVSYTDSFLGVTFSGVIHNEVTDENVGDVLVNQTISLKCGNTSFTTKLTKLSSLNSLTSSLAHYKLRGDGKVVTGPGPSIQDGTIGFVHSVSCGSFDTEGKFETTYTWKLDQTWQFRHFSYFGNPSSAKFHVALIGSAPKMPLKWEWMQIHQSNIRGMIIETPINADQDHRVVFIVVDKPPRFYQRTTDMTTVTSSNNTPNNGSGFVHSRVPYPSMPGFEWAIQYARVIRIEYEKKQNLTLNTLEPRPSKEEKEDYLAFECGGIELSDRTVSEMVETLEYNLDAIQGLFQPYRFFGGHIGVLKLLYNCNVSATSSEASDLINHLMSCRPLSISSYRLYSETLKKVAQDIGSSQVRALQRFHMALPADAKKLPGIYVGHRKRPSPHDAVNSRFFGPEWRSQEQEWAVWGEKFALGAYELQVYPSHVELLGPIDPKSSSITDTFRKTIDSFLRVRFVDNDMKPLRAESGISLDAIIRDRVVPTLNNDFQPLLPVLSAPRRFEFLGYTMSSLKKKKAVWFFLRNRLWDAKKIRDGIGTWDENDPLNGNLAKKPSKWGARLSLAFSESIPVLALFEDKWDRREDYPTKVDLLKPGFRSTNLQNTDGCGLISPALCQSINATLIRLGFAGARAFQIRFPGSKGVIYSGAQSLLDEQSPGLEMLLRDSQIKTTAPGTTEWTLRVASDAGEGSAFRSLFFESALKAFEDSGADTKKIEMIYDEAYNELVLSCASSKALGILKEIHRIPDDDRDAGSKARYRLLKLAVRLQADGIYPEDYKESFLALYLSGIAKIAREQNMFKIPIPGSCQVLGLTDDYKVLIGSTRKTPNKLCEVFIRSHRKTITGPVLIYRDPIIHIGDIQEAEAVSLDEIENRMKKYDDWEDRVAALSDMNNVIFFSQEDDPPLPNRLSGGDLDGDRFEVITKSCGFWGDMYKTSDPEDYVEEETRIMGPKAPVDDMKSFDISEVAKFIGDYIQNDCFQELQQLHMCLADLVSGGLTNDIIKGMSVWLSRAVDYPKQGQEVNLARDIFTNPEFVLDKKPDFVRAFNPEPFPHLNSKIYQSENLLGRIYRGVTSREYVVFPSNKENGNRFLKNKLFQIWGSNGAGLDPYFNRLPVRISQKLNSAMYKIITEEMDRFAAYTKGETTGARDDVLDIDLVLRNEFDYMLADAVDSLVARILHELESLGMVNFVNRLLRRPTVRLSGRFEQKAVEQAYKLCLHAAWDWAIIKECESYAFLCLYALYCENLKLHRDVRGKVIRGDSDDSDRSFYSGSSAYSDD